MTACYGPEVEVSIDGQALAGISQLSFKSERHGLIERQEIRGKWEVHLPRTYSMSGRLKFNSAGRRWFRRLVRWADRDIEIATGADLPAPLRQLLHVLRGCGPGGRRGSKVSRRLLAAMRREGV